MTRLNDFEKEEQQPEGTDVTARTTRFTARAPTAAWLLFITFLVPLAAKASSEGFERSQSDIETEDFLATAEIVASEDVGEGITKPIRLTLRKDGVERHAIFKTVDEEINEISRTTGWEPKFTDKYVYEVAAYRIDRLAGINLVPVTVLRTIDGDEGSVQIWIEEITTMEQALIAHGDSPMDNFDLLLERLMLTYVLDALIYNIDRNHTNILVDFANDRFHPIDHSRAFRLYKKLPPMQDTEIPVPDRIASRIKSLDLETLQAALGELLEPSQIKAVDKRRKTLIKEFQQRGLME
jgi:hypothetical protein